jgi:hypothetical protein
MPIGIWDVKWTIAETKIDHEHGHYPHTEEGKIFEKIKESKNRKYYEREHFIECHNLIQE